MRINDTENYGAIKKSISMNNLRNIIESKNYSIVKVATNSHVSDSTLKAYMNPNPNLNPKDKKIPSLPTLISLADYLNCNLDYLLDRTNNPMKVDEIDSLSKDKELSQLVHTISSLDKNKRDLVNAYVQGLLK